MNIFCKYKSILPWSNIKALTLMAVLGLSVATPCVAQLELSFYRSDPYEYLEIYGTEVSVAGSSDRSFSDTVSVNGLSSFFDWNAGGWSGSFDTDYMFVINFKHDNEFGLVDVYFGLWHGDVDPAVNENFWFPLDYDGGAYSDVPSDIELVLAALDGSVFAAMEDPNFLLTVSTPEPSSLCVFLGVLGLLYSLIRRDRALIRHNK